MDTVTIASSVPGLVIGSDDAGLPVKLRVGDNRVPEVAWRSWLVANFTSHLIADGRIRRIEKWQP